jgi:hypothetical protein
MGARMGAVTSLLVSALLDSSLVVPFAHDTGLPHQEPGQGGGGTGIVLVVGVLFVTLIIVGLLVWLDRRGRRRGGED